MSEGEGQDPRLKLRHNQLLPVQKLKRGKRTDENIPNGPRLVF